MRVVTVVVILEFLLAHLLSSVAFNPLHSRAMTYAFSVSKPETLLRLLGHGVLQVYFGLGVSISLRLYHSCLNQAGLLMTPLTALQ